MRPPVQPLKGHLPQRVFSARHLSTAVPRTHSSLRPSSNPTPEQPLALSPGTRPASTNAANVDWVTWLKRAASPGSTPPGKALLFAGLGSYPHIPHSPTPSSLALWEEASEALMSPDATLGYQPKRMDSVGGRSGWMRSWVEGRSLDELMKRPDITAPFILTSSIAVLASAQEKYGTPTLLPEGTTHLAGHGFIGTLTALVAAGRLDLATGARLARIYANLPASPPGHPRAHLTTVLSARHFHSLSSPSFYVPPSPSPSPRSSRSSLSSLSSSASDLSPEYTNTDLFPPVTSVECEDSPGSTPLKRRRAMQLILDEIHGLESEWEKDWAEGKGEEWAGAGIINSSKVLVVTGTHHAVLQVIERLQQLNLANPVMDVMMPCPYHTKLMTHAIPRFSHVLERCHFKKPEPGGPVILDPMTTHPIGPPATALLPHLTAQLRWHKTLTRLYASPIPKVGKFLTVGRGAKGLGIMLRGETKRRVEGAPVIGIEEFGVGVKDERVARALAGRRKVVGGKGV